MNKVNDPDLSKKIELMIKVITRTDSYLNSANTKSTILLSLSSAIIVALSINYEKITGLVNVSSDKKILSFLMAVVLFLLIASVIFSLKGITPYIKASMRNNTFSFIDISLNYSELVDYKRAFIAVGDLEFLNQLIALNYNLSNALVTKYEKQITAITFLKNAAYVLGFLIFIIILSNC
ncbi:hypothetical protein [Erwinia amylovora]|uniref:hypothetical protein n=1 Tax=Erwinia amylovora TaxID=552 RepID=UPI00144440E1|nr:hypothetical protein [Erwinia amylovora]